MLVRLHAIQASWNYETMMGPGIAFALEPALRRLPGGPGGPAYRAALARHARYFNAHPYLAALAVGALARAELDGEDPVRIERFRTACCGPLGSVGDRLIWAGWLPLSALIALAVYGLGASPAGVVAAFVVSYNLGHVAIRVWGLRAGWREGLRLSAALAHPVLRQGPEAIARAIALVAGLAVPFALARAVGGPGPGAATAAFAVGGAVLLQLLPARLDGWRAAFLLATGVVLLTLLVP
jgi:PTS system mannose-specific IID component